jgi:carotenoid cleavage dioxygenase-like enzyme
LTGVVDVLRGPLPTGELFGFGWKMEQPYLHYFVVGADGKPRFDIPISTPEPSMMHDFAMTEDYVIFLDMPMLFRPKVGPPCIWACL